MKNLPLIGFIVLSAIAGIWECAWVVINKFKSKAYMSRFLESSKDMALTPVIILSVIIFLVFLYGFLKTALTTDKLKSKYDPDRITVCSALFYSIVAPFFVLDFAALAGLVISFPLWAILHMDAFLNLLIYSIFGGGSRYL